jgi:hypothetical protein
MAGAGLDHPSKITRRAISRRVLMNQVKGYEDIYPYLPEGCLLQANTIPEDWKAVMNMANAAQFQAV